MDLSFRCTAYSTSPTESIASFLTEPHKITDQTTNAKPDQQTVDTEAHQTANGQAHHFKAYSTANVTTDATTYLCSDPVPDSHAHCNTDYRTHTAANAEADTGTY